MFPDEHTTQPAILREPVAGNGWHRFGNDQVVAMDACAEHLPMLAARPSRPGNDRPRTPRASH